MHACNLFVNAVGKKYDCDNKLYSFFFMVGLHKQYSDCGEGVSAIGILEVKWKTDTRFYNKTTESLTVPKKVKKIVTK